MHAARLAHPRSVESLIKGRPTRDGAGVALTRLLQPGSPLAARLDPFLMLDAFDSADPAAYVAGFPNHPHRGQETLTLMFAGALRHADNRGGSGVVQAGGASRRQGRGRGGPPEALVVRPRSSRGMLGELQGRGLPLQLTAELRDAQRHQALSVASDAARGR